MSMSTSSSSTISCKRVSFGNPALGTYKGNVYTRPQRTDLTSVPSQGSVVITKPVVEGAEAVNRMVAMVNVPPEHVPESLLNLIRSHRPFIEHVRVVIADTEDNRQTSSSHEEDRVKSDFIHHQQMVSSSVSTNKEDRRSGRTYLVLFQMTSQEDADTLVDDLNGQPYIAFDDQDTCMVEHVVALQGEDGVSLLNPHFAPSVSVVNSIAAEAAGGTTATTTSTTSTAKSQSQSSPSTSNSNKTGNNIIDDQNCAVCLERLAFQPDEHQTTTKASILTTVCNHTFHLDCLRQWSGPCIVCRFDHSGLNETLSQCHVCGTTEHNYVCLICGCISCVGAPDPGEGVAVAASSSLDDSSNQRLTCSRTHGFPTAIAGCGHDAASVATDSTHRFDTSHAGQHYSETLHAYALDTQNQHVYDFAGQGYVHRLVQNKEDGKLVEINDPYNSSQERSLTPGLSDAQEGEVVHRKLEGFASQYYTLLKSQLEQQRTFYEGRLQEIRREFATKERNHGHSKLEFITVLRQERKQLIQRLLSIQRKKEKALDDAAFLKSMNDSLQTNKSSLDQRIQEAQRDQVGSREMMLKYVPALEEKVTTLILQLEDSIENESNKIYHN
jgi:BRCA1-associated protein